MATKHVAESISINAAPEAVYALISDIERTPEWSPVVTKVEWDEGSGPEVGGTFVGTNVSPERTWQTNCTVLIADGRTFGWRVGPGWASWFYDVVPGDAPGTTILTERWEYPDLGQEAMRQLYPDEEAAAAGVERTIANAETGINASLHAIRGILEA